MAMRELVTGGAACAVPGSSSSSNPFGNLANAVLSTASKGQVQFLCFSSSSGSSIPFSMSSTASFSVQLMIRTGRSFLRRCPQPPPPRLSFTRRHMASSCRGPTLTSRTCNQEPRFDFQLLALSKLASFFTVVPNLLWILRQSSDFIRNFNSVGGNALLENAWDDVQGSQLPPPPMHGPQLMYDRGAAAQLQPALDGKLPTDCYTSFSTS